MNQQVEDSVGERWITAGDMPAFNSDLAAIWRWRVMTVEHRPCRSSSTVRAELSFGPPRPVAAVVESKCP